MGWSVTSKLLGRGDPRDSVRPRPATTPAREEAAPKMYNGTAALSEPCRKIGIFGLVRVVCIFHDRSALE